MATGRSYERARAMSRGRAGSCAAAARETPSGGLQRMRLSSWERMTVCASSVRSQIQTEVWHTRLSAAAGCLPEDELSTRRQKPVWVGCHFLWLRVSSAPARAKSWMVPSPRGRMSTCSELRPRHTEAAGEMQ